MAELTQMQPLFQDELEKGEMTFEQLWQGNVGHLERVLAEVRRLPEQLEVSVETGNRESILQLEQVKPDAKFWNEANILLKLTVENKTLSGQNRAKVKRKIENQVLAPYRMVKPEQKGGEYELTIPFEKEEDLSVIMSEILWEMDLLAELDDCWVKHEISVLCG